MGTIGLLAAVLLAAEPSSKLTIDGPSEAKTGELVRVIVDGLPKFATLDEMYAYRINVQMDKGAGCDCTLDQSLSYDLTKQTWRLTLDLRSTTPGTVVLMVAECETCELLHHRVVIGGKKPDPDPDPGTFAAKVKAALELVTASKDRAPAIGQNYREVADDAEEKPDSWTPANMINVVKTKHAQDLTTDQMRDWAPFWPKLAQALRDLKLGAADLPGHIKAFRQIAEVLD